MNLNEKYMKPIKGQITMIAHKGGHFENGKLVGGEIIDTETIQNLIVNSASVLMAERMAPGAITGATNPAFQGNFASKGLQYLALGVGILKDKTKPYDEKTNNVDRTLCSKCSSCEYAFTDKGLVRIYSKELQIFKII